MKMFTRFFWCLLIGLISFPTAAKAIPPVGISPYYGQQGFSKGYFNFHRLKACQIKGLRISFPFLHQRVREKRDGSFYAIDFHYGTGKAKYGEGEDWDDYRDWRRPVWKWPYWFGLPDTPPKIDGNVKVSIISFNPSYGYVALSKSGNETEDFSNEFYEFYVLIGVIIGKVTFDPNISYDPKAMDDCFIALPNENNDFSLKSGLCLGLLTRISVSLYKDLAINGELAFNTTPNSVKRTGGVYYTSGREIEDVILCIYRWNVGLSWGF